MNPSPDSNSLNTSHRPFLAGLTVLASLYLLRLGRFPTYPAFGDDNSMYLVLAKSLASGHGFRLVNYPDEPISSLYPIGYPALLALVFHDRLVQPQSVFLARLISIVTCLGFIYLGQRLLLRYAPAWVATGVALALGLGVTAFTYAGEIWSECPFAMMVTAAIGCAGNALDTGNESSSRFLDGAIAAGLCAGLAMLLRSVGITIIAGILLTFIINARWRQCWRFSLAAGIVMAPWLLWTALHKANTFSSYHSAFLAEFSWLSPLYHIRELCLVTLPTTLFPAFEMRAVTAALAHMGLFWVEPVVGLIGSVLVIAGMYCLLKRRDVSSVCIVCYMGVVIICPWELSRYALPLLPVLAVPLLEGYRVLILASKGATSPPRWAVNAQYVCIAAALCGGLGVSAMRVRNVYLQRHWAGAEAAREWVDMNAAFGWIDQNLPPNAVLVSSYPCGTYLFTARQTLAQLPGAQLGEILAGAPAGRPLYVFATERSYYLTGREFGVAPLRAYMAAHPGALRLVWSNQQRNIQVYAVPSRDQSRGTGRRERAPVGMTVPAVR